MSIQNTTTSSGSVSMKVVRRRPQPILARILAILKRSTS